MREWQERNGNPRSIQDGTFVDPVTGNVFQRETFIARDGSMVIRRFDFDPTLTPAETIEAFHNWRSDFGFSLTTGRAEDPQIDALARSDVFRQRLMQLADRKLYEARLLLAAAEGDSSSSSDEGSKGAI